MGFGVVKGSRLRRRRSPSLRSVDLRPVTTPQAHGGEGALCYESTQISFSSIVNYSPS